MKTIKSCIILSLVLLVGCQSAGRKLFGVKERDNTVTNYKTPSRVEVPVDGSDVTRVLLSELGMDEPSYINCFACTTNDQCAPLPYTANNSQATYVVDRAVVTIYEVNTVFPGATKIRIDYIP